MPQEVELLGAKICFRDGNKMLYFPGEKLKWIYESGQMEVRLKK